MRAARDVDRDGQLLSDCAFYQAAADLPGGLFIEVLDMCFRSKSSCCFPGKEKCPDRRFSMKKLSNLYRWWKENYLVNRSLLAF